MFIDTTHVNVNANLKTQAKKVIHQVAKNSEKQLFEEINKDREEKGKLSFDKNNKLPKDKVLSYTTTNKKGYREHFQIQKRNIP